MNILFIGGTGNISGDCAALLHQRGHKIFVLTRGQSPIPAGYTAVRADHKDAAAVRAAVQGLPVDVVANFIAYDVPDVARDFELFGGRVQQYIFISTTAAYVKPPQRLPLTENEPLGNPYWDYAKKKQDCEDWLRARPEFPVTIVRPSHTYSKRWVPNVVASAGYTLAARFEAGQPVFLPNNGDNLWTLTATSDFAVGFAGLAGNARAIGEAFHITSDERLPWLEIYGEIAAAAGVHSPVIETIPLEFICDRFPQLIGPLKGDKANPGIFDNTKIKTFVPDFQCRKKFAVGIRESVAWMRQHPADRKINAPADELIGHVVAAWHAARG
jgi:nucleoside-diphosphate-sugar epimerase